MLHYESQSLPAQNSALRSASFYGQHLAENDRKHLDLCVGSMGIDLWINKELASKYEMHRKTAVCEEGCGEYVGE